MSAVKTYPRDTSADEMRQRRQARRVQCNGASECACGNGCPTCRRLGHHFLGLTPEGRVLQCFGCGTRWAGVDMFTVINRAATDRHFVGHLCGEMRCTCRAGEFRRNCYGQDRVRDFLGRESADPARAPRPIAGIGDVKNLQRVIPSGPPRADRKRDTSRYPSIAGELA